MSSRNRRQTSFQHLPPEIILQIFAFFPLREVVTAFSGLNSYINSTIRSMRGATHVVRGNDVDATNLLHLFPIQISRLIMTHAGAVDFTSLINLRSLTLKYGSQTQFNSIRPQHFPMLEILYIFAASRNSSNDNIQTINDLFQVILSNGFPRLRICKAVRIGNFNSNDTWTGSPALRLLQLDMKTTHDYEQLLSVCPNLRRFTSNGSSWVDSRKKINDGPARKRLSMELKKIELLDSQDKFIMDMCSTEVFCSGEPPPRFNNTTITQRFYGKNCFYIQGRILPQIEPYCRASFLIEIKVPQEFPFKPPEVIFLDPIYHPGVDNHGCPYCCCDHFLGHEWRPTTSLTTIVEATIRAIDNFPEFSHSLDVKLAEEYQNNRDIFYEKALKHTLLYGRPRY